MGTLISDDAPSLGGRMTDHISIVDGGPLRLALVGAGRFGRVHAAKIAATPGVELAAVVDRAPERAHALAAEHGAQPFANVARLNDALDAPLHGAVVAVDLAQLAPMTAELLDMRLHVLAEKPLALDATAARQLVSLAAQRRRVLAVGFVERFAVPALAGRHFVSRRAGARRSAAPLALDWMVHDLDHAVRCLGPDLQLIEARLEAHNARIRLVADGREARITVDGRRPRPWRRLWIDGQRIDPRQVRDPLAAEVAAFCAAIRGRPSGPLAMGEDAVAVLSLLTALDIARTAA